MRSIIGMRRIHVRLSSPHIELYKYTYVCIKERWSVFLTSATAGVGATNQLRLQQQESLVCHPQPAVANWTDCQMSFDQPNNRRTPTNNHETTTEHEN